MEKVNLSDYQKVATESCFNAAAIGQHTLGLTDKVLNVANTVKAVERYRHSDYSQAETRRGIADSLGEVIRYCAALSHDLGYSLEEIALLNYGKLKSRQKRNKIHGSGDNR